MVRIGLAGVYARQGSSELGWAGYMLDRGGQNWVGRGICSIGVARIESAGVYEMVCAFSFFIGKVGGTNQVAGVYAR